MVELTDKPIDLARVLANVTHEDCGAEVLFVGTTRRWTSAEKVREAQAINSQESDAATSDQVASSSTTAALVNSATSDSRTCSDSGARSEKLRDRSEPVVRVETQRLYYEAYRELALEQMRLLESQALERWPIRNVVLVHRLGDVLPKEASVAVAVSCPHRSEAFEAAKWLIDTLKHEVPIWKQEHYEQHGSQWIHPTRGSCNCDHSPTTETVPRESTQADTDTPTNGQDALVGHEVDR